MVEVVVLETDEMAIDTMCLQVSMGGLGGAVEFHLCSHRTSFREILAAAMPKLVLTSWSGIGGRVMDSVRTLEPRPEVWVMTLPEIVRREELGGARVFDKMEFIGGHRLVPEIRAFLGMAG